MNIAFLIYVFVSMVVSPSLLISSWCSCTYWLSLCLRVLP